MISKHQIKYLRSLQQKKYRDEHGYFIVEGVKIVNEAIEQVPKYIKIIFYTDLSCQQINISSADKQNIKHSLISQNEFDRITALKNSQQVLAVIDKKFQAIADPSGSPDLILALDHIQDPGNLGTIIRLADWFGISKIYCSEDTVDCYNPKVVQASMGSIFRIEICYDNLPGKLTELQENSGYTVYGSSLDGENVYEAPFKKPAILVLGNESKGVSKQLIEITDKNLLIPNFKKTTEKSESLNVSIAAAIICAEFRRKDS